MINGEAMDKDKSKDQAIVKETEKDVRVTDYS